MLCSMHGPQASEHSNRSILAAGATKCSWTGSGLRREPENHLSSQVLLEQPQVPQILTKM